MPDLADQLMALGAATLGESGGRPMASRIRAVWPGARLAAPAFAVRCTPGDNLAVHVAVARAPAGSAPAVEAGIERGRGSWGEGLPTAGEARGIGGPVIGSCGRAGAAPPPLSFPAFRTRVGLRRGDEALA